MIPLALAVAAWLQAAPTPLPGAAPGCAVPLLQLGADGQVAAGSKEALRAAALRGDPLRVGWRLTFGPGPHDFLQHWTDALFVTVFEGETFAQIAPIHRQQPQRGRSHVALSDVVQIWYASIGSDGKLVGRFGEGGVPQSTVVAQAWCLGGEAAARCTLPAWRLAYSHDADGKALEGGKEVLFAAIRRGDPIRVSWGASGAAGSVEHSADPVFTTIASNREAYGQLPAHALQSSYAAPGGAAAENPSVHWRAVIGTDGRFDAAWYDEVDGEPLVRRPQRAGARWLAFTPDPACDPRPVPVLAVAGGVRLATPPSP
jgi:hypothetical protein